MKKGIKRDLINILFLIVSFFIYYIIITKFKFLYGSVIDWEHQHFAIPEYFRNLFYATHDLFPDFALNLGSGQNLYNLSYYGFLSPVILFSYLLPFISMQDYIIISTIVLLLLSAILMYFFIKNKTNTDIGFICSFLFLIATPMLFHSHRHIMFINYMPFLMMGYIGIDNYFKNKKTILLTLSVFLMIMTSYFFSVGGILSLIIYGIYCYIREKDIVTLKSFIIDGIKFLIPIFIGILMSAILIVPTFYSLTSGRTVTNNINIISLLIPKMELWDLLYSSYSLGLSSIALFSLIYNLFSKKKNNLTLSIILFIILLFPIFKYLLNGGLYLENKVLIPLMPLFIILISQTLMDISTKKIDINFFSKLTILLSSIIIFFSSNNFVLDFIFDFSILYFCMYMLIKKKTYKYFYLFLFPLLLICSIIINLNDDLVIKKSDSYDAIIDKVINEDKSFYRINIYEKNLSNVNKIYNLNHYSPSIYSSSSSLSYEDFYYNRIGNEISHPTYRMMNGTNNLFYNIYLGNKYIISNNYNSKFYEKIDDKIYKNDNVLSVGYSTDKLMSEKYYNTLSYPDNIYAYLDYTIIDDDNIKTEFNSIFDKINLDYEIKEKNVEIEEKNNTYKIKSQNDNNQIVIKLNNDLKDKILLLSFNMKYQERCSVGDTYIKINDIKNELSCYGWKYNNNNYQFKYVFTQNNLNELKIKFSKGNFEISDIVAYTLDDNYINKIGKDVDSFIINTKKTTNDKIIGSIDIKKDGYFNISIPYDKGFIIKVDGKKVLYEKVDFNFIGFKIDKGHHEIEIEYKAPFKNVGIILSLIGLLLFIIEIAINIINELKNPHNNLFKLIVKIYKKYREIINYLIVGGLTTIVSLIIKWGLLFTILNADDALELQIAILISWFGSVLFAYITNRLFVFCSKNKQILKEMIQFFGARVLTLILEMVIMWFFVTLLKLNTNIWVLIWTIITQILVIIFNYIFSKLFVFKKK